LKKLFFYILAVLSVARLDAQTAAEPVLPGTIRLTDSVSCTPVKDQSQTSTCWVFGTNSLFESDLLKRDGISINLSEMFIARYAYIDKARQYLATGGTSYFEGGGQFHDVIRVVNKYGMVPEEVYNGRPHGERSHDHAGLDTAMQQFIQGLLKEGKTGLDTADLRLVEDTLDKYLGKVPASFYYRQKSYTPKNFAEEVGKFGND